MKARNRNTGAITELSEYGFTLLPKAEWERYEEPVLYQEPEGPIVVVNDDPDPVTESDKPFPYEDIKEDFNDDKTPQAKPEKPSKAKPKTKK